MGGQSLRLCLFLVTGLGGAALGQPAAAEETFRIALTLELGPDRGQNPGSLFEVVDDEGRVVAGAGFCGAYNTQPRSDREQLQVFVRRPGRRAEWTMERLPPVPSEARGFYPFVLEGTLYLIGRSGPDPQVYRWDESAGAWQSADDVHPYTERIAGRRLSVTSEQVLYDGRTLLDVSAIPERWGEHYYAHGQLVLRQHAATDPPVNQFVVYDWRPETDLPPEERPEWRFNLTTPGEFVYAFGQRQGEVLVVTNTGGVRRLNREGWKVLREPVPNVSYQVYTAINWFDRLLLGHYPTGEAFDYAGAEPVRLAGWPPRPPGVSPNARELQTLAIYGGNLYAGVWPWGEVWRYDRDVSAWDFVQRVFTHPALSEQVVHPYEAETRGVDRVHNLWGQRVTGLAPLGRSLVITTSSKGGGAWEPRFDFLSPEQRADYGAVYRATIPGNLAVTTRWQLGPSRFEFSVRQGALHVTQDDQALGSVPLDEGLVAALQSGRVRFGTGVFGGLSGRLSDAASSLPEAARSPAGVPRPMLGAYFHPDRFFPPAAGDPEHEATARAVLDELSAAGLNAIQPYFTGSSGQAYYASRILPERVYRDADPLGSLVREARRRGVGVYPVVCVAVCGHERPAGILLQHPDWSLRHPDGSPLGYISPAHPDARQWLVSVVREIAETYRPDGILLDYIRYHNRPLRLDVAAEERFQRELPAGASDSDRKEREQSFKEAELTELVRMIRAGLRSVGPQFALGAYVWGPHTLKGHLTAQVWPAWVAQGQLDFVNVSGYYHRDKYGEKYLELFERRMTEARELARSAARHVPVTFALGVNTSHGRVHSADEIRVYLDAAARARLDGAILFTWHDTREYLEDLRQNGSIREFLSAPADAQE